MESPPRDVPLYFFLSLQSTADSQSTAELEKSIISDVRDLQDLLNAYVRGIGLSEVRRVCSHICKSYSRLGEKTLNQLSRLHDKEAVVNLLCEEVGLENVEPLFEFEKLLSIESIRDSKYSETLLKHQERMRMPHSIECTSPPGTPLPYINGGTMIFFFSAGSSHSPLESPTSTDSQSLGFPMEAQNN